MMFRFFLLLSAILFPFSVLTAEKEKLVIVETDNIPEAVKNAVKAIGTVDGVGIGFFLDEGVFTSSNVNTNTIDPSESYSVSQFREITAAEKEVADSISKGSSVSTSAGQATLMSSRDNWGVFKVKKAEQEGRLFVAESDTFLKIAPFNKGDRVFLLSAYHYEHSPRPGFASVRKNLIMEVTNSADIQDIEAAVDMEKNPLVNMLRGELNSIAVNQKGEVIGFLNLSDGVNRLIKFDSEQTAFLSEKAEKILKDKASNNQLPNYQPETEEIQPEIMKGLSTQQERTCLPSLFRRFFRR